MPSIMDIVYFIFVKGAIYLGILIVLLLVTAYVLLADRKIWAAVQLRRGPNVVGPFGLLQSFADFIKFVFKEPIIPDGSNRFLFLLAPVIMAFLCFLGWAIMPFAENWVLVDLNLGILYVLSVSSMSVYATIMAGWASNSKYPFLAGLRGAAQMISYEVSIGFILLSVLLTAGSLNLSTIILAQKHLWFVVPHLPLFVLFFISALAETNRPPFDLLEAESELVAGFMTEYSSTPYLLFMLGEYINILFMCAMATTLFLGGWLPLLDIKPFTLIPGVVWFCAKVFVIFFFFSMAKAMVPRYRYDQLMRLGWKVFLPFSIFWLVLTMFTLHAIRS